MNELSDRNMLNNLELILYNLYRLDQSGLDDFFDSFDDMYQDYTDQEIRNLISASEWALSYRDYDFNKMMPNLRFSNIEVVAFLERFLNTLKSFFDKKHQT